MGIKLTRIVRTGALALSSVAVSAAAWAQEATVEERLAALEGAASAYVDNGYLFLIGGFLVMFMAAGFLCLEAGLVRKKNAAMQSLKNIALFSIAGIMFYFVGYNLVYPGDTGFILGGWLSGLYGPADFGYTELSHGGYPLASDWFFQMVFVATAASIVSGTVAERVKLLPFLIFTAVLTGFIYPVVAGWQWGGGALSAMGFSDFAGSTLVHSTGGWAALMGAIIIGPRAGKYFGKQTNPMPGSNIPLAGLGTFILWFGWFGFNGASQLAAGSIADINSISQIFANTNLAACGGVLAAMLLTAVLYKGKIDATMAFNGAIGGLVAITAEPLMPSAVESMLIGAVGGVIVVLTVPMLDKLKIDDVVGAIPAHLFAGIWGTMAVAFNVAAEKTLESGDVVTYGALDVAQFGPQAIGVGATAVFVCVTSGIVWLVLKMTIGVRVSDEDQLEGLDKAEVGIEAYPEFG